MAHIDRQDPPSVVAIPAGLPDVRELGRMMEEAVDGLPDLYRSAFVLREIEGMSTDEAASSTGPRLTRPAWEPST